MDARDLAARMKTAGVRQEDVAAVVGCSRQLVGFELTGRRPLSPSVRAAAETLIAVRPGQLLAQAEDLVKEAGRCLEAMADG